MQILANESALHLRITVSGGVTSEVRTRQALSVGVRVLPVPGTGEILLSIAGIAHKDIAPAVQLLAQAWA